MSFKKSTKYLLLDDGRPAKDILGPGVQTEVNVS